MGIFVEAYEALKDVLEAEDTGKPHQLATRAAFRASATADTMADALQYGRIPATDANKVSDLHKAAYDKHMDAAKANRQANQLGTAQSHAALAAKHGKLAAHFHTLNQAAGSASQKAVGESIVLLRGRGYPSLLEVKGPADEDKISPDEIDGTDDEFELDEKGLTAELRMHLRAKKAKKK